MATSVVRGVGAGRPFVWSANNAKALDILNDLGKARGTFLLLGPKGCGKTTLLQSLATKASAGKEAERSFSLFCSAIEIYAAVFIRENEVFLEKLGKTSFVAIDDIDLLETASGGDSLLHLLLAERTRAGFSTVLSSSESFDILKGYFADCNFSKDNVVELEYLDTAGKVDFAKATAAFYGTTESPHMSENAFLCLASQFDVPDIDRVIRFFMTASDYRADDIVTPEFFDEIISQEGV